MASEKLFDVLIVGAGPAGLQVALGLARQLHPVVVFDSGVYRNERADHFHNIITWDHKDPKEFRQAAKQNILDRYNTIQFENVEVAKLEKREDGKFVATDANGKAWVGKKVVIATGVKDVYPDIEGYGECWGYGIFQCLFCHGYDERNDGSSGGVLAVDAFTNPIAALHVARQVAQLTGKGRVYTNGNEDLGKELQAQLSEGQPIEIDTRRIARLEKASKGANVILHFEDGRSVNEGFLAHKPKNELIGKFHEQLGLEVNQQGDITTTPPFYQTSARGVFACGDGVSMFKAVANALYSGAGVAAGLSGQIQADAFGHKGIC